jgi:hypothetical protein
MYVVVVRARYVADEERGCLCRRRLYDKGGTRCPGGETGRV